MCGRYVIDDDGQIAEVNKIMNEIGSKVTGEIFPTNIAPILSLKCDKPSLNLMTWGFPKWDNKGVIINAKSETVSEKRMFAKPFYQHRCVVISTGFFEWNAKDKYRFNSLDTPMLYMAGVSSDTGDSFVILTRPANGSIIDIHERMPVILYKDELVRWLTDYTFARNIIERNNVKLNKEIVYAS